MGLLFRSFVAGRALQQRPTVLQQLCRMDGLKNSLVNPANPEGEVVEAYRIL